MSSRLDSLSPDSITRPCSEDWAAMSGGQRLRHCARCARNVVHLSRFGREEAEAYLEQRSGKLCVRAGFGPDGKVRTRDEAPRAASAAVRGRRRWPRWMLKVASWLLLLGLLPGCDEETTSAPEDPVPAPPEDYRELMGEVCLPEEVPPPPEES